MEEAIGFASQSIQRMKAFQFGLEMRFFTYFSGFSAVCRSQQKKLVLVDGFLRKIYVFPIPLTNSRTQIERRDPQPKWKPCCFEGKSTLKDVAKHPLYYSA